LPLPGHVVLEGGQFLLAGGQYQVTVLMEVGRLSRLLFEALEEGHALDGEPGIYLLGELLPDAAGAYSRGAGADGVLFQDEHVPAAALGKVIGDAAADDTGPDYDDIKYVSGQLSPHN